MPRRAPATTSRRAENVRQCERVRPRGSERLCIRGAAREVKSPEMCVRVQRNRERGRGQDADDDDDAVAVALRRAGERDRDRAATTAIHTRCG